MRVTARSFSPGLSPASRPAAVLVAAAVLLGLAVAVPAGATGVRAPQVTAPSLAGLDPGLPLVGDAVQRVVVTGTAAVAAAVRQAGGQVRAALPIVNGVAADVAAGRLRDLAADARVATVTADRQASFEEYSYDETTVASNFAR